MALDDVTFSVNPKEFISIVGHSGAGKSTLVKMLLAEDKPTKGKVFFESKDVKVNNNSFQTIFQGNFFDLECTVLALSLFTLLLCFFYPTFLLLVSQYAVLGSYWF